MWADKTLILFIYISLSICYLFIIINIVIFSFISGLPLLS